MKRYIAQFLILMVLSMSLAYSLDSFMEIPADHSEFTYMNDLEQHHQGDASVDCDHCCHGTAHLTGITSQPIAFLAPQPEQYLIVYTQQLAAITHTPPTPPPTA